MTPTDKALRDIEGSGVSIDWSFSEPAPGFTFLRARFSHDGRPYDLTCPLYLGRTPAEAREDLIDQVSGVLFPMGAP